MKYLVRMDMHIPDGLAAGERTALIEQETVRSHELQRAGKWPEIWRVVGEQALYSIFDVTGDEELQEILEGLPLYPHMRIGVTPLAPHPLDIKL